MVLCLTKQRFSSIRIITKYESVQSQISELILTPMEKCVIIQAVHRGVAQLVARDVRDVEVASSSLVTPTSVSVHKGTHIFYICYEHSYQRSTAITIRSRIAVAVLVLLSRSLNLGISLPSQGGRSVPVIKRRSAFQNRWHRR